MITGPTMDMNMATAMFMNMTAMNNPLLSQVIMESSRPKFSGSADNFSEFRRQWGEYSQLIKDTYPAIGNPQLLTIFKTCLDNATALQLQREIRLNPSLTIANFLAIMERDFGKDFSTQAREEWRAVKLTNAGRHMTSKDWRQFQLQFEIAAERVDDKGEKEEYDLL